MYFHLTIPCPENILWWLICICIIGVMISSAIMLQAGRFSLTRDGEQVSVQKLHLMRNATAIDGVLRRMSTASRQSLRRGLRGDFLFMPFFYGLLICIGLQLRLGSQLDNWESVITILCLVPLLTLASDLLENFAMLGLLAGHNAGWKPSPGLAWTMAAGAVLKWTSGIGWLVMTISLLVATAVV
jgi:hypothetical protein